MDRIASMDMLLMKMAIAETLHIPSVPVKVSLNVYIDSSKEYSTPNIKTFVNGVLDKIIAGDVYVTGSFTGTVDFDPSPNTTNLVSSGSIDIFVLKITSAGVFSWAKKMGGTGDDAGYGVAVHGAGNVNITGTFSGTANFNPAGTFNLTAVGSFECFVVQLIVQVHLTGLLALVAL